MEWNSTIVRIEVQFRGHLQGLATFAKTDASSGDFRLCTEKQEEKLKSKKSKGYLLQCSDLQPCSAQREHTDE